MKTTTRKAKTVATPTPAPTREQIGTALSAFANDLRLNPWAQTADGQAMCEEVAEAVRVAVATLSPSPASPAPRRFIVTLTKRSAYRLRDFTKLFNVSAEDNLALLAGEQLDCLDDDVTFEMEMGRHATAFRHQREATVKTESQQREVK